MMKIAISVVAVMLLGGCSSIYKSPQRAERLASTFQGVKLAVTFLGVNTEGASEFKTMFVVQEGDSVCELCTRQTSHIILDGVKRYRRVDFRHGIECPFLPPGELVQFRFTPTRYPYLNADKTSVASSPSALAPGQHSLAINYAGQTSRVISFVVE